MSNKEIIYRSDDDLQEVGLYQELAFEVENTYKYTYKYTYK